VQAQSSGHGYSDKSQQKYQYGADDGQYHGYQWHDGFNRIHFVAFGLV
jgi:hypothetical protein